MKTSLLSISLAIISFIGFEQIPVISCLSWFLLIGGLFVLANRVYDTSF